MCRLNRNLLASTAMKKFNRFNLHPSLLWPFAHDAQFHVGMAKPPAVNP